MPTSATGTSSRRRGAVAAVFSEPPRRQADEGFSLLELLVVLVIIGIFFGAAMLAPGIVANDRNVEQEARRLKSVIDLVREEALMQSRDFGVLFGDDGYRFYFYDYEQRTWVEPADDELLAPHALDDNLEIELLVEDRDLMLEPERDDERDAAETPEPQVMILSSGELTPFEVLVRRETDQAAYRLTAQLTGSTEIEREESISN